MHASNSCYCCCEAEVRSSSVSIVYTLHATFAHSISKVALQKRGSMEPMEPPLDPPLYVVT